MPESHGFNPWEWLKNLKSKMVLASAYRWNEHHFVTILQKGIWFYELKIDAEASEFAPPI